MKGDWGLWEMQCKREHCGRTSLRLRAGRAVWRAGGRFQRRVTPFLSLSGEHMARHRMISYLQVPFVSQPPDTMLSTDRSASTHGQPSTSKHPQEFLTHIHRVMIYNLMLFPRTTQSHFNNDQDKRELIKHWHSGAYKTENMLRSNEKT